MSETTDREIDVRSLFSTLAIVLQLTKQIFLKLLTFYKKFQKFHPKLKFCHKLQNI